MNVLTEADLRTEKVSESTKEYHVKEGTFVTPAAFEYLQDRNIRLVYDLISPSLMTHYEMKERGAYTYMDAESGDRYGEKPENMTHLRSNLLIPKTHSRVALRGKLDTLQAQVLFLQKHCKKERLLCEDLENVLTFLRAILRAEVMDEPMAELTLFGYNQSELRKISHQVKAVFGIEHPVPDSSMSETALLLNLLRTQVREAELTAVHAFPNEDTFKIVQNMNRLSSGIYILFCRTLSGFYKREEDEGGGQT